MADSSLFLDKIAYSSAHAVGLIETKRVNVRWFLHHFFPFNILSQTECAL